MLVDGWGCDPRVFISFCESEMINKEALGGSYSSKFQEGVMGWMERGPH